MDEIWRPIAGYKGKYEVSDAGRVRSCDRVVPYSDGRRKPARLRGSVLVGSLGSNGYITISLPGRIKRPVHRLVAAAFLPPPAHDRLTINHKNGVKTDNRAANLEWATYRENNEHARDTGLCRQHGSNTNLSKFHDDLIAAMRRVYVEYKPTYRKLGELFDMSPMHAWEVVNGKSRKRG